MNRNKYPKREEPQPQPQQPQQPQEVKKGWVEVCSLFHQGNGNTYKKLGVQVSDGLKVILTLTEGETGSGYTKISFQLSEQELIYLAEKLRHLFFRLGK
jgi:hypothetical protein